MILIYLTYHHSNDESLHQKNPTQQRWIINFTPPFCFSYLLLITFIKHAILVDSYMAIFFSTLKKSLETTMLYQLTPHKKTIPQNKR